MLSLFVTLIVGLVGGLAVGTQTPIAGAMSARIGGAASSVVVHLTGLVASLLLLIATRNEISKSWGILPWYMWCSGGFGLVLYLSVSYTIPRLGATSAIALIIVGQLLAGVVIDANGFFATVQRELDTARVIGIVLLLAGAYLTAR